MYVCIYLMYKAMYMYVAYNIIMYIFSVYVLINSMCIYV